MGGQGKLRSLWRHYYPGTQLLLFVVDAQDAGRLDAARDELATVLREAELRTVPLIVMANKQDLPQGTRLPLSPHLNTRTQRPNGRRWRSGWGYGV